jgi:hypothetical protein
LDPAPEELYHQKSLLARTMRIDKRSEIPYMSQNKRAWVFRVARTRSKRVNLRQNSSCGNEGENTIPSNQTKRLLHIEHNPKKVLISTGVVVNAILACVVDNGPQSKLQREH